MKLIYLSAKEYPGKTADHVYMHQLGKAFHSLLGDDFLFVAGSIASGALASFPQLAAGAPKRGKTFFYFFWLLYFVLSRGYSRKDVVFFLNDPNLLSILIFWKKVARFHYRICSDWHMLFRDWRDRFIARGSNTLVSTSSKLKQRLVSIGEIGLDKILVAYGGVDLAQYPAGADNSLRERLNLPRDKKLIAYVGYFKTMGMEKGIHTMIEALPLLSPEVTMLFVGGKAEEIEEYRAYAKERGVGERCIFVGIQSPQALAEYERTADILAIPYPDLPHFREYGFPMKLYEYMASGRPVIYSKLDLVEEVVGDCAFPFTPDDASALASTAKYIFSNGEEAVKAAARAREKVEGYSWQEKARRIVAFINL